MSLVDSLDSVLMLYAYASPSRSTPEGKLGLFQAPKLEIGETDERERLLGSGTEVGYQTHSETSVPISQGSEIGHEVGYPPSGEGETTKHKL
jgi:hypothetical protein